MSPAGEVKTDAERTLDEAVNRAAIISSDAAAVHEAFGAFVRGFDLLAGVEGSASASANDRDGSARRP